MSGDELLVVAASAAEAPRGLEGCRATLLVVGVRAPRLPVRLPGGGPVLVTGACGSLRDDVRPGTLVVAASVEDDEGVLEPDAALTASLVSIAASGGRDVRTARVVSVAHVVDGDAAREALRARGDVVDMESAAIARACVARGRPWAVLRYVTDAPGEGLEWLATLLGGMPAGDVRPSDVLRGLLRRPWLLPRVVGLGRRVGRGAAEVSAIVRARSARPWSCGSP